VPCCQAGKSPALRASLREPKRGFNEIWLVVKSIVLVVEDEMFIRLDAVDIIESAGFCVLQAANADEAIKLLETRLDISVVFTDIDMPGSMDGLKLAAAIRGRWPPIKIIATSGRFNIRDEDLPAGGRFFPKPYFAAQVTAALLEMTSGR
jgi:CheY-like chemotaxis protein